MVESSAPSSSASASSAVNSTNSTPSTAIRSGMSGTVIRMPGSSRLTRSISATSERRPSTAIDLGEPPRNWSLKISSDSGPL